MKLYICLLLIVKIIIDVKITLATIKLFCREILRQYTVVACVQSIADTKVLKRITNTAFTCLCKIAATDYELPEDDTIVSKHVRAM